MKKLLTVLASIAALCALGIVPVGAQSQPFVYFVGAQNCSTVVSGNSTGTNGQTTAGASSTPVVQAQTSNVGTNTHTYLCTIAPPARLVAASSTNIVKIVDAVFLYGVQTTALGTQVATLASGTFNSSIVFSTIAYPTAGASETPSTVTPVRGDSGTMAITPAAASANVATTTAGSFFSQTFTPATPIVWNVDLTQLLLTVTLLNAATSATITNSPGVLIHMTTAY